MQQCEVSQLNRLQLLHCSGKKKTNSRQGLKSHIHSLRSLSHPPSGASSLLQSESPFPLPPIPTLPHPTHPPFFFFLKCHEGCDGWSPRSSRRRPHRWGEIKVLCELLTALPFFFLSPHSSGGDEWAGGGAGATCSRDITALSHIMYHLQLRVKPGETDLICHL